MSAQYPLIGLKNGTASTGAAQSIYTMPGDCDLEAARNLFIMFARLKVKMYLMLTSDVVLVTRGFVLLARDLLCLPRPNTATWVK